MATSNFSGFDDATQKFFWNGAEISGDRYRYELNRQQQVVLQRVNKLVTNEATKVVAPASGFSQQAYGGFLRSVIPSLLDQYGKVNATAAIQFYNESELAWRVQNPGAERTAGRGNVRLKASRYALARTQGVLATQQGYGAQYADDYALAAKSDNVINFAMKIRAQSGQDASVSAMNNALTREVAMFHRDTVLFNSALDANVSKVQRVANPGACDFCRLMAIGSTNGKVRTSSYAVRFHSNCQCTIQPLFGNDQPIRPPYYDDYEKEYAEASKSGGSAKQILARMRANAKAQTVSTKVTTKVATKATASTAKVIDERLPEVWPWEKAFSSIPFEERKTLLATANQLRREIPLANTRAVLKTLPVADTLEEAMKNTNPNYDILNRGFRTNCARVIQAYELRRRGFNVVANAEAKDSSQYRPYYLGGWKDLETGKTAYEDKLQVQKGIRLVKREEATKKLILDNHPDGSRGAISFYYTTGNSGHTFNWERVGDEVIWVDAQPGTSGDKIGRYFTMAKDIDVARLDNKEPMAQVMQYLDESSFE